MKISRLLLVFVIQLVAANQLNAQNPTSSLNISVSVSNEIKDHFKQDGRLFIYLAKGEEGRREPRFQSGLGGGIVFAKNVEQWNSANNYTIQATEKLSAIGAESLNAIPNGTYRIQILWDQDREESRSNIPGNIYSEVQTVKLEGTGKRISIKLTDVIPEREVVDHPLVEEYSMQSEVLSNWWKKPMNLKVSVLLPSGYESNPDKKYPVRYNVAGYGGRYTRVDRVVRDKEFMDWWTSADAPQIITVFLDGEGPFGDSYQLDSENNGPYGEALTTELIPAVEKEFRIIGDSDHRFVDGCSTGGWVSLALQLFYPEHFSGCYSYSPDPVDFHRMQLINVYDEDNAFFNKSGLERPSRRDIYGEPDFTIKQEVESENVQGYSNTYTTSGGQWGGWNAVYSPKGKDGLPVAMFDPVTGAINKDAAEHWKKYDLNHLVQSTWSELGPKIQGKVHIWMGDMDNYYLNNSMRDFDAYLKTTENPKSDAQITFLPMTGHCSMYSHRKVLEMIADKLVE